MSEELSKRRMAENEVVFRTYNERVRESFDEIKAVARESGQEYLVRDDDTALHFYCECSDENCRKRILLKPSEYSRLHMNRKHFVLICGHETNIIEKVVQRTDAYCVVEKFVRPYETARSLSPTGADNS